MTPFPRLTSRDYAAAIYGGKGVVIGENPLLLIQMQRDVIERVTLVPPPRGIVWVMHLGARPVCCGRKNPMSSYQ